MYGTISFVEKIFRGIAVNIVQKLMPDLPIENTVTITYFKWVLAFGCGGGFLFSLILVVILMPMKIGSRYRT